MKTFFATLKTILQEGRILREAWGGSVKLPSNYWRTRLVMYVFGLTDKAQVPNIFKNNYCPLFWFSNFLLFTSPLWLLLFGIVWVGKKIGGWLDDTCFSPLMESIETKSKVSKERKKQRSAEEEIEARRAIVYNDSDPDLAKLQAGKEWYETWLKDRTDVRVDDVEYFVGKAYPSFLVYYARFRQRYGDDSYESRIHSIAEGIQARWTQERAEEQARREQLELQKQDWNRIFISIINWTKIFGKAFVFVFAVPVIALVAWFLYELVILVVPAIFNGLWYALTNHFTDILLGLGLFVAVIGTISGLVFFFKSDWFDEAKDTTIDGVGAAFGATGRGIAAVWRVITSPFVWVGRLIWSFCEFIVNFFRMFFSQNCPGITYDEEVKSE